MDRWSRLSERQILKAKAEGKLQGLTGEGAPLPDRPEQALIDAGTAAGHRIMAEAGALPREISLKKEIDALRQVLAAETIAEKRKSLMARLADLEMRHAMEAEARRKFLGS